MVWKNIMKKKGKHKMKQKIHPVSYSESRRKEGFLYEGLYRQTFVWTQNYSWLGSPSTVTNGCL